MLSRLQPTILKGTILTMAILLSANSATAQAAQTVKERNEIPTKYLWKTEAIFKDVAAWEAEYKEVEKRVENVATFKGTLGQSAEQLLKVLEYTNETESRLDRVYVFGSLRSDQDTRVSANQELKSRGRSLWIKYSQESSWMTPELLSIPQETINKWMDENSDLAVYRHFFDNMFRQQKHILPEREEQLLALTGEIRGVPGTAYNFLSNADLTYPTIKDTEGKDLELSDSAFYVMMRSTDRRVRREAYEGIVGAYAGVRNTAAALLNGAIQSHILTVKARGYESCLQASLDGENIPVKVYDTLVESVNDNLHLLHRYQEIRRKALKIDKVHAYDLFAPLITGETMELEYEDAKNTVLAAVQPLGEAYVSAMRTGLNSRWVDVFPTKGKRSGAYSSGTFLTQPYILLNYHGGYEDMSTLAHELGHSMHSYYSRGTQPYVYADYSIFCAEVASITNEVLLQELVLKRTTDPRKKLYLLCELLEGFRGTIFRQTMFSEFEQKAHEMAEAGIPLTADSLGAAYGEIMKKYYGPAYEHDDLVDNYWIRIPHFYYNFYVYKYATSHCAASNIANRILAGEPGAVEAYLSFLKAGSHKYPIDVLKLARVDMTTPEPIEAAMAIFESLLDQTETLLDQVN